MGKSKKKTNSAVNQKTNLPKGQSPGLSPDDATGDAPKAPEKLNDSWEDISPNVQEGKQEGGEWDENIPETAVQTSKKGYLGGAAWSEEVLEEERENARKSNENSGSEENERDWKDSGKKNFGKSGRDNKSSRSEKSSRDHSTKKSSRPSHEPEKNWDNPPKANENISDNRENEKESSRDNKNRNSGRYSNSDHRDREDRSSRPYGSNRDNNSSRTHDRRVDRSSRSYDSNKDNNSSRTYDRKERSSRPHDSDNKDGGSSRTYDRRDDKSSRPYESRRSEPFRGNRQDEERSDKRFSLNDNDKRRGPREASNDRKTYKSKNFNQDPEFLAYNHELSSARSFEFQKVRELTSDLFKAPDEYSLAHCVAEDMNMGSGIAVQFRYKFKKVDELLNQHQNTGGLAVLTEKNRYIYYLVTKKYSFGKPTYETLFSSLKCLRDHVIANKVETIAMPRIGCGLDRLEWNDVKFMLEFIFKDVEIDITVCNLEPTEDSSTPQRHRNCKVTYEKYPIEKIDPGTVILYFSTEDGEISEEMKSLDEKFRFLIEFKNARKSKGNVVLYTKNPQYLLCGCIVRKSKRDVFDFTSFQKCLSQIQKENKKLEHYYYAFQAFRDHSDRCINYKLINVLRNSLRDIEVYVCWPGDLINDMAPKDRFSEDIGKSEEARPKNDFYNKYQKGNNSRRDNSWTRKSDNQWTPEKENIPKVDSSYSTWSADSKSNQESYTVSKESHLNDSVETDENNTSNSDWFQSEDQSADASGLNLTVEESFQNASLNEDVDNPQKANHEYETFKLDLAENTIDPSKIKDVKTLPTQCSRVCFASEDLKIFGGIPQGSDIAPSIGKLLSQQEKPGGLAYAKDDNGFLYCLIISEPKNPATSIYVFEAIQKLKIHVTRNVVKKIALPATDISGLKWAEIKNMFAFLLGKNQVDVFAAPSDNSATVDFRLKENKLKIVHKRSGIHQMSKKSVILYLSSVDGQFSEEMTGLSKKFEFSDQFKKKKRVLGDVIKYKENEDFVLYGCIIKKRFSDCIEFEELRKCFLEVKEKNKQEEKLQVLGIQAVRDPDQSTNFKILSVLAYCFENLTINVCWPGDLKSLIF